MLEQPGLGRRLNPLSLLEQPNTPIGLLNFSHVGGRRKPLGHCMAMNGLFLNITRSPSTTMRPMYFDSILVIKKKNSA